MATIDKKNLRGHIQEILSGADLSSLSSKKVRRKLEEIFDEDLSARKKEIDDLLMTLIAERQEQERSEKKEHSESEHSDNEEDKKTSDNEEDNKTIENGRAETNSKSASSESESDIDMIDAEPPKKKQKGKTKSAAAQNDEELAKQLQAEEESGVRRSSRAATTKNTKATIKRSIKYAQYGKKSDDPDAKAKKPRQYILSPQLAELMETDKMGRSEVVKRMWEIVKERNLSDPKNKSFMICDEEMQKIFGRKRVRTFGMMKYLTDHMFTQEQYDYSFT